MESLSHNMITAETTSSINQDNLHYAGETIDIGAKPVDDDQRNTTCSGASFADEIQALKTKILELERQSGTDTSGLGQGPPNSQLDDDFEQYKRMEACLYKHRKEWEKQIGPGNWRLRPFQNFIWGPARLGKQAWKISHDRVYPRPNPFDPSHDCTANQDETEAGGDDEYDRVIDYGNRREWLRKNFEWEMDRLYLVEEMERRKKDEIAKRQLKREQQTAETEAKSEREASQFSADEKPKTEEDPPACPEPKVNRVEWPLFKLLYKEAEEDACVIDILIGEPIITDDVDSYQLWYGTSNHQIHKPERPQDRRTLQSFEPGQGPLPERIRIHSRILLEILSTIAGGNDRSLKSSRERVVLIRPFKLLLHCEQALRDWCSALERKFEHVSSSAASETRMVNDPGSITAGATMEEQQADVNVDEEQDSPEDKEDGTKSPEALKHLRCLLGFLNTDIETKRAFLSSSMCRKIFFSDLWHLFRPGMEVIGRDGKQAYRVIEVTSAKHRVTPAWHRFYNISGDKHDYTPFSITCVYIDFDGKNLGPVQEIFDFKRFDDERDVTSLEVYPLRFHPVRQSEFSRWEWEETSWLPESERYRQKLLNRGRKFLNVAAVKHMYYAGPTLDVQDDVESQVVIDFETAFSMEDNARKGWKPELTALVGNAPTAGSETSSEYVVRRDCEAECCRQENVCDDTFVDEKQKEDYVNNLLPKGTVVNDQPSIAVIPRPLRELRPDTDDYFDVSDDELVIMSYRVFGFVLRSRKWAKLDLSYLTDVHLPDIPNTSAEDGISESDVKAKEPVTAFDRLALQDGHRDMIVSLIAQHFRDKKSKTDQREEFDIVRGKGKGLILLLHGAPGVGKTSTAEGVAELFKKPLFQITCGDLGTTASEVETALETNFALANRWDCILLLDEADVFLAERTKEDFKRNGLVAVFLRVMEYYAGILFLTTNRVGDFDEAFTSRIHISLYYPELDRDKTVRVFEINLDMIQDRFKKRGRAIKIQRLNIGSFASQHFDDHPQARWNGRQIRNACQTALALAEFKAQGSSHREILRPNAEVELSVDHFKVVRDAYLEFTRYMNELFGINATRRAKEARLRAVWNDRKDQKAMAEGRGASAVDRKAAFIFDSQAQPHPSHGQPPRVSPQPPPHLQYHPGFYQAGTPQQQDWQQQQQLHGYQDFATPQPGYSDPTHTQMPLHQQPTHSSWNSPGGDFLPPAFQNPGQVPSQTALPRQAPATPTPPQRHPQHHVEHASQPWFRQGIEGMYERGREGPAQITQQNYPPSVGVGPAPDQTASSGKQWMDSQGAGQQAQD